jgi:predicted phage terminase large subunit-like protein
MDKALEEVVAGRLKRVIIEMPPRHGKSERVSRRLPAAYLGRHPDGQVVHATYNGTLAKKESRAVQRIMTSPGYKALHPETMLPSETKQSLAGARWVRKTEYFEIVNRTGYYMATGIGGTLTGTGMTLGIIDDPIKDPKEADSETIRDNIWDWYLSTFLSRDEGDAAIVICATRWHEDDLIGRILQAEKEAVEAGEPTEGWVVIKFEAIREDMAEPPAGAPNYIRDHRPHGAALWPDKFNDERLGKIKARLRKSGIRWWNALYQQRPSAGEGAILRRDAWHYATEQQVKEGTLCKVLSADTAFSTKESNARSVIGTFAILTGGDKAVLIDVDKGWWAFPQLKTRARTAHNRTGAYRFLIEDKASGKDLIPELAESLPKNTLVPVEPAGDKVARANAVAGMIEAPVPGERHPKQVLLLQGAPYLEDFLTETAAFPTGKFSDQVDMFTQFCSWYRSTWKAAAQRLLKHKVKRRAFFED